MNIGMIGVGHLGAVLTEALLTGGLAPSDLHLTARGKGAALAARLGCASAPPAQVVAASDLVLLVVRPADAVATVAGLPWRAGQRLVSACAGVPVAQLAAVLPPGVAVHRIMPLTAAAQGASPTVLFPADPAVEAVIAAFGPPVAVGSEEAFEIATVSAALYGWVQRLVQVGAEWSAAQGLPPDVARRLVALTAVAAGRNIDGSGQSMPDLLRDLVTPGGITELGLQVLDRQGVPDAWEEACAAVLTRLRG